MNEASTGRDIVREAFEAWWDKEGSSLRPTPSEDQEEHAKRVAAIAWSNGMFKRDDRGRYTTGDYKLTAFDDRGTKIVQFSCGDMGLNRAIDMGNQMIERGECASFNIDRNLFNSKDQVQGWR